LINPFYPPDEMNTDQYEIYTTTGTLALTSKYAEASFGFASKYIFTSRTTSDLFINAAVDKLEEFDGDLSCEVARTELESADGNAAYWRIGSGTVDGVFKTGFDARYPGYWTASLGTEPSYQVTSAFHATRSAVTSQAYYVDHCLNKSDIITFLNFNAPQTNPSRINLYTTQRIFRNDYVKSFAQVTAGLPTGTTPTTVSTTAADHHSDYMTRVITTDLSTNWAASVMGDATYANAAAEIAGNFLGQHIYKFFPAKKSTYNYVAPCSNRGICDTTSGLCQCFPGYTSDACSEQSSLAI